MSADERTPSAKAPGAAASLEDADDEPKGVRAWLWEIVRAWGPAILAVLLIRAFIFEPFRIPSGSMVPTLLIGDHVLVTKFSYGVWLPWPFPRTEVLDVADPERGDIVVFKYPKNESVNYIKRVVGLPGDRIRVQNNQIYINGEPQERVYVDKYEFVDDQCRGRAQKLYVEHLGDLPHSVLTNTGLGGTLSNTTEIEIPADSVFVMGDNRDNSEDSRRWDFVRYDQIKGKAHFIWLSWDRCAEVAKSIRTDRFGLGLYKAPPPALSPANPLVTP